LGEGDKWGGSVQETPPWMGGVWIHVFSGTTHGNLFLAAVLL